MARIRTVKPELANHELLFEIEQELQINVRFAWVMLFTQCDREGRFKWRPNELKTGCLPHDPIDFSRVLDAWLTRGLVVKYRQGHTWYGVIPTFLKHQAINNKETASILPDPRAADETIDLTDQEDANARSTRHERVDNALNTRDNLDRHAYPSGREGNRKGTTRAARVFHASESREPRVDNASVTREEREDDTLAPPELQGIPGPDPNRDPAAQAIVDSMPHEQAIMAAFPATPNRPNWMPALRACRELVDNGLATWPQLVAVSEAYAAYLAATGSSVNIAAHNFFDRRKGSYWQQDWSIPTTNTNGSASLAEYDRRSAAKLAELPGDDPGPM